MVTWDIIFVTHTHTHTPLTFIWIEIAFLKTCQPEFLTLSGAGLCYGGITIFITMWLEFDITSICIMKIFIRVMKISRFTSIVYRTFFVETLTLVDICMSVKVSISFKKVHVCFNRQSELAEWNCFLVIIYQGIGIWLASIKEGDSGTQNKRSMHR